MVLLAKLLFGPLLCLFLTCAAVVDRIAVIIGNTVITEGEVLEELRLTQFINRQPLDLSPPQRLAAAERLVDRELIRNEMQMGYISQPSQAGSVDSMLRKFCQGNFDTLARYRAALAQYGITEDALKGHFVWQLTVTRFVDNRFHFDTPTTSHEATDQTRPNVSAEEQMKAWLKQARSNSRIVFKEQAFQ